MRAAARADSMGAPDNPGDPTNHENHPGTVLMCLRIPPGNSRGDYFIGRNPVPRAHCIMGQ